MTTEFSETVAVSMLDPNDNPITLKILLADISDLVSGPLSVPLTSTVVAVRHNLNLSWTVTDTTP